MKFMNGCKTDKQGGIKCANRRTVFIDSEDPKHTLFCRETASVDRAENLPIEENGYQ